MKYKVSNVIEMLRRLPPARWHGQVMQLPELKSLSSVSPDLSRKANVSETFNVITVQAQLFRDGNDSWLEWMIEIN